MGVGVTAGYFLFYKYENKGNTRGGDGWDTELKIILCFIYIRQNNKKQIFSSAKRGNGK